MLPKTSLRLRETTKKNVRLNQKAALTGQRNRKNERAGQIVLSYCRRMTSIIAPAAAATMADAGSTGDSVGAGLG